MYNSNELSSSVRSEILEALPSDDRWQAGLCIDTWVAIANDISDKVGALLCFILKTYGFRGAIARCSEAANIYLQGLPGMDGTLNDECHQYPGAILELMRLTAQVSSNPTRDVLLVLRFPKRFTPHQSEAWDLSKEAIDGFLNNNRRMKRFQRLSVSSFLTGLISATNREFSISALIDQHMPHDYVVHVSPYEALPNGATAEGCHTRFEKLLVLTCSDCRPWDFPAVIHTDENEFFRSSIADPSVSRMVCVPKNFEKSRTIAMEPVYTTVASTDIARALEAVCDGKVKLPRASFSRKYPGYYGATSGKGGHPLTPSDHIFLHNQGENRDAARFGAIDGELATIDTSAASDSVSPTVVGLFFPTLLEKSVTDRLSHRVSIDGQSVLMHMYSTMGSRVTFPLESLVFLYIAFLAAAICIPLGVGTWEEFSLVRVYGDDVVLPTVWAEMFTQLLQKFGFKPNHEKTFMSKEHPYRESCGAEWLSTGVGMEAVVDVAAFYWPRRIVNKSDLATLCKLHNVLYTNGFEHACAVVRSAVGTRVPQVVDDTTLGLLGDAPDYTLVHVPDEVRKYAGVPSQCTATVDASGKSSEIRLPKLPYLDPPNGICIIRHVKLVPVYRGVDLKAIAKRFTLAEDYTRSLYNLFAYHDTLANPAPLLDEWAKLLNVRIPDCLERSRARELVMEYDDESHKSTVCMKVVPVTTVVWLG